MKAVPMEQKIISNAFSQIKKMERSIFTELLLDEISSGRCLTSQEVDYLLEISSGNITGFIRSALEAVSLAKTKASKGGCMTGLRNE